MDRKTLREFTHKADSFLHLDNNNYKQWVFRYTFLELEKDLGAQGDITTKSVFKEKKQVKAKIIAKQDGVFAGREEVQYFLVDADPKFRPSLKSQFKIDFRIEDGQEFKKGDVLMEIEGDVSDLLAVERVLLNLIMRMSGVATFTRKIVKMVEEYHVLVTPTRKALWGLLDKKAAALGGGGTHRLCLADAILVKDTHLDALGRNFDLVLANIKDSNFEARFIEIEVESLEEVMELGPKFVEFLKEYKSVGVILLDNMTAEQITEAMVEVKKSDFYDKLLFEVSGGINEENVLKYAKTGADIISMGSLTSGVKSVDMSLKIAV
ncbi:MAG: carboxylating nicotinate-nucleotide diphosphorylase [Patescibacteria group bacterium]|mgnify:CR=1 FL=1